MYYYGLENYYVSVFVCGYPGYPLEVSNRVLCRHVSCSCLQCSFAACNDGLEWLRGLRGMYISWTRGPVAVAILDKLTILR